MLPLFLFHKALFSQKVLTAHKLTLTFEIIMISSTLETKKMLQNELCASKVSGARKRWLQMKLGSRRVPSQLQLFIRWLTKSMMSKMAFVFIKKCQSRFDVMEGDPKVLHLMETLGLGGSGPSIRIQKISNSVKTIVCRKRSQPGKTAQRGISASLFSFLLIRNFL